jgi:RimJ/RimL family protein N-acetyltransferase
MLRGNMVILRPVKRADIPNFLVWFNDTEVSQYMGRNLPLTEMEEEKWIEGLTADKTRVNLVIEAIVDVSTKPIGTIGFQFIEATNRQATFGIGIGEKDFWNNGYGTEAARLFIKYGFEQLNLNRVNSNVFDFNVRSQKMHLKIGFKQEGLRRQAKFVNGSYHDVVEYGLLREDWEKIDKQ